MSGRGEEGQGKRAGGPGPAACRLLLAAATDACTPARPTSLCRPLPCSSSSQRRRPVALLLLNLRQQQHRIAGHSGLLCRGFRLAARARGGGALMGRPPRLSVPLPQPSRPLLCLLPSAFVSSIAAAGFARAPFHPHPLPRLPLLGPPLIMRRLCSALLSPSCPFSNQSPCQTASLPLSIS